MTTEEKKHEAAWERIGTVDHATRLLTLHYFSRLYALLTSTSLHTLNDDTLLEWSVAKQLQLTTLALTLVFALLSYELIQSLNIKRPAVERRRRIELDDEGSDVRPPTTSAEAGLSLEDHGLLAYRAGAPLYDSIHSCSVITRIPPL